ncbi:glycosyltransferase family 4 protein [Wenxinia saemankumensis]|uniref:Glycosyltransferase involved in cell wall bisynthesis n=1 Tax=Wenxinia saemankumensis TaxID=1447782 RepID=A0A1M6FQB3_9RHOB|nr:glycosyltransferase family 4 protein [Wenxinia saemankumensis]SHI99855.1 Glycosyltransferase involved in cell wall bisynthesis [Wenxinia saemankumensis]
MSFSPVPRTPAIFFHSDAIEGAGRDLVGRRSAGSSFLGGWLDHVPGDVLRFVVEGDGHARALRAVLAERGEGRAVRISAAHDIAALREAGTVFYPGPGFQEAPWIRQRIDPAAYSLVGLTHTVSTRRVVKGLHELVSQPVENWDAIICTSRAVQSVVERQFEVERDFFVRRFGATRVPLPRLPVIPLGIDTAAFAPRPGARETLRARFDVAEGDVVVMTMGRWSVLEKANPVPLYQAARLAAGRTKTRIHLWITGWASRKEEEEAMREGAAAFAGDCQVVFHDGRDAELRRDLWAAADIFTLPADSIQETFGLVPVEAMAAGLPVVMPDWNGFRDTVRHGETGLLVPTAMAGPGFGAGMAARALDGRDGYLPHLAAVQTHVAIDVAAYADALARLVADPGIRRQMGARAARHAADRFDWRAVVPLYLDLARDLAARREGARATTPEGPTGARSPVEIDVFDLYRQYPARLVGPDAVFRLLSVPTEAEAAALDRASGRALANRLTLPTAVLPRLPAIFGGAPRGLAEIARALSVPPAKAMTLMMTLVKAGHAELCPVPHRPPDDIPDPAPEIGETSGAETGSVTGPEAGPDPARVPAASPAAPAPAPAPR